MILMREGRVGRGIKKRRLTPCIHLATATFLLLSSAVATSVALAGDLDKIVFFNIKAQNVDKALLQFGAQAHVQISFAWDSTTARLRTRALKGRYTEKEALAQLLKGTRLTYVMVGHTVAIELHGLRQVTAPTQSSRLRSSKRSAGSQNAHNPGGLPDPPATHRHSESSQQTQGLREVIVTAQKYRQSPFDVPISLDVVTGQEIQQREITRITDLQYDVPGLVVDGGQNAHRVYLQGVGNVYGNGSLVGEYIDEADVTALATSGQSGLGSTEASLYDLSRVEVLRGPQGTLYGDGSMGGVIRYITNEPDLEQFQMNADVAAGLTEFGAPSQRINAMLNTPLTAGALGLRFAGLIEHDGGWVDQPAANLKNINSSNLVDVRAEALWQPIDQFKMRAMQIEHRDAFGIGYDEDVNGNIPEVYGLSSPPNSEVNFNLSNLTTTVDFYGLSLLNSASHSKTSQDQYDLFDIEPRSSQFGSVTLWSLSRRTSFASEDYSDELRISKAQKGHWQWTVGGFYKHFRDDDFSDAYSGLPGPLSSATHSLYTRGDISSSWAGFANTSYELMNRLTLGGGVRYFKDHETTVSTGVPLQGAAFSSTDPRFYVQYRISPHVNSYATASKGFRSGGFNVLGEPPYAPETLWSYNMGAKLRYLEDRLQSDVAFFHSDYRNYVVVGYFPPVFRLANAGTARIQGVDADLAWRLNGQWRIGLNTELLNTKFVTVNRNPYASYAVGDRLPYAPTYSFTASIERDFRWNEKPVYAEVYYYEISRTQFRQYGFNLGQSEIPHFLNLRAGLQWNDNLRLGVLATNLLNDRGSLSPVVAINGESMRPQPRTLWIQFGVTFGQE